MKSIREKIDSIFPEKSEDFRNRFALENKMKVITDVVKAELDVRKQIDSSLKQEMEMEKKLREDDLSDGEITHADITSLIRELEKYKDGKTA
jgi:hypothetical protein